MNKGATAPSGSREEKWEEAGMMEEPGDGNCQARGRPRTGHKLGVKKRTKYLVRYCSNTVQYARGAKFKYKSQDREGSEAGQDVE